MLQEGQLDDWFGSLLIVRLTALAAAAIVSFVVWELWPGNRQPAVNLRVLRDRNLVGGSLLAGALGFGLVGGLFIFPLFVQGILGFTATETGLVLFPAGLAILAAILVCSTLIQKGFDPRILIGVGVATFIAANWYLGHLSPQSDAHSTLLGQVLRGVGIGCLFIPITVTAFSTLQGAQIAQGTALWNLALQLGGSLGIATLNTYVVNMAQLHRATLVEHLTTGSAALGERQAGLTQVFITHGYGQAQARSAAHGVIEQVVTVQSLTMAYDDAFLLIAAAFFLVFPAIFLLRRPAPDAAPVAMH